MRFCHQHSSIGGGQNSLSLGHVAELSHEMATFPGLSLGISLEISCISLALKPKVSGPSLGQRAKALIIVREVSGLQDRFISPIYFDTM